MRLQDLTGIRFGRLIVQARAGALQHPNGKTSVQWACFCDCGRSITTTGLNLRAGDTRSCGCLAAELHRVKRVTKPQHTYPEYAIWRSMKERCFNPRSTGFDYYGGRGITVCAAWQRSFKTFLADVGPRPTPNHTLDRENGDGHYEPGNVRWVTLEVQNSNRRGCLLYTINGETLSLAQWCRRFGMNWSTVHHRLHNVGMSIEEALTSPLNEKKRRVA